MPRKIDPKILQEEIMGKVRGSYPYFLVFYLLSLAVACFSRAWSNFFYWPAFHAAAAIFTVLFLSTLGFNPWGWCLSRCISFLKHFKSLRSASKSRYKKSSRRAHIFKKNRLAEFFVTANRFAGFLFKTISCSIKEKIIAASWRTWAKVMVIAILLIVASLKGVGAFNFLILFYALISVLFILDSRWSAAAAVLLLASCPVLLILKREGWAESAAIYAYYFLVITVVTQVRELRIEKRPVDKRRLTVVAEKKR